MKISCLLQISYYFIFLSDGSYFDFEFFTPFLGCGKVVFFLILVFLSKNDEQHDDGFYGE
jgi:hypothetical protein